MRNAIVRADVRAGVRATRLTLSSKADRSMDQQQLNFLIKLDINDRFQLSYSSQSRAQVI